MKTGTALIASARKFQYLMDEGFFDDANKELPNYIKSHEADLDRDAMNILRPLIRRLAKAAHVSRHAAQDALINYCIRRWAEKRGII